MLVRKLLRHFALFCLIFLPFLSPSVIVHGQTIAIISDTHLRPDNTAPKKALEACIEEINNSTDSIDLVLVTGDLTEMGDRPSLLTVFHTLHKLNVPFLAVSGNHETKWSQNLSTAFKHIFGYDRFSFDLGKYRLIGFNTGPIIRMMDGHISPSDLSYIEAELSSMPSDMEAIIVTHYPLLPNSVDNWYDATSMLRKHPIAIALGGHHHQNQLHSYDGIPGLLSRSSLFDPEGHTGYTLLQLQDTVAIAYERRPGGVSIKWAEVPLGIDKKATPAPLPDFSMNSKNNGAVQELWKNKSEHAFFCAPTYANGIVVAADDAGLVQAYDATTGNLKWSYPLDGRVIGAPYTNGDVVVVGTAKGKLACIDLKSGQLRWTQERLFPQSGAPVIDDKIVYIGDNQGTMSAYDLQNGNTLWSNKTGKNFIETRPLIKDNLLIYGAWDQHLYAVNKLTGETVWQWKCTKPSMHYSPAAVWPVANDKLIFVTTPERFLYAIDLETGKTVGTHKTDSVRETVALSKDHKRVYSKTMNDAVICLTPDANLQPIWRCDLGYGYDHAASMPIELENGCLVVVTKNGFLGGINAKDGKTLWKYKIGNTLINTPVATSKNTFAYTTLDGLIGVMTTKN